MPKKERRNYTREFKLEAIRLYETTDKSMAQVERELGITETLLSKWVRKHRAEPEQAFPGKGKLSSQDEKLRQLKREIEILRQEREILKKAVAIFSRASA